MTMLRETHERIRPVLERRDHGFRWRGTDISRVEGLSDAVFAFAITLLVVSLEAPHRFVDLQRMMHGFVSFAICFGLLLMIWHAQYIWFRRYALDDATTFVLNAVLLFMVAFYVYPLKFLFSVFADALTGYHELDAAGRAIEPMRPQDWRPLMMIYSAGFVGIYSIFALLYRHAWRMREALELNALELYETRGVLHENLVMIAIGIVALGFAAFVHPSLAGITYGLIGPIQAWIGARHGKRRKEIVAAP